VLLLLVLLELLLLSGMVTHSRWGAGGAINHTTPAGSCRWWWRVQGGVSTRHHA
jgi:hypothetical protein